MDLRDKNDVVRVLLSRILFGAMIAASLGAASAYACQGKNVQFEENFSSPDASWGSFSGDSISIKNGKAVIKPAKNTGQRWVNPAYVFDNVFQCVVFKMPAGKGPAGGAGVAFWYEGPNKHYTATIGLDGKVRVNRLLPSGWVTIVPAVASPSIKVNAGDENEIEVAVKGNSGSLFVNGAKIADFKGQPPKDGGPMGMYAESEADQDDAFEFSLVRVADQ